MSQAAKLEFDRIRKKRKSIVWMNEKKKRIFISHKMRSSIRKNILRSRKPCENGENSVCPSEYFLKSVKKSGTEDENLFFFREKKSDSSYEFLLQWDRLHFGQVFFFLFHNIPNPLKSGQRRMEQVGGHSVSCAQMKISSLFHETAKRNAFMKRKEIRNAMKECCQRSCNPGCDYTIQNLNEKKSWAYSKLTSRFVGNTITVIRRIGKYHTGADTTTTRLGWLISPTHTRFSSDAYSEKTIFWVDINLLNGMLPCSVVHSKYSNKLIKNVILMFFLSQLHYNRGWRRRLP